MTDTKYHYEKKKLTMTRFEWLQMLPYPHNIEAINAVREVKGEGATEYLEVVRSGHNPINVFLESVFFKDTKLGTAYWIDTCKRLEKEMKLSDKTKKHIIT